MTRPKSAEENPAKVDDGVLFRAAIGEVTLLTEQNHAPPARAPLAAIVRSTPAHDGSKDSLSDFSAASPPEEFLRNGIARQTLRKLKRGSFPIESELDLHGYQIDAARELLQAFLHEALQSELRCVRVIHGKGMNSKTGEAVLRRLTRNWLTQHPQVLAFCPAPIEMGGAGAVLLLLKRSATDRS
ncbi:MAG: Smr/MutS family protein [Gallionella sp.]|nr:Smr/MutS family protein [Gallionella sp.]MDD4946001.1 Smr/MutS family protein [Gallionella sp.]MDD5613357.1 Smr/MutS family protein [Gallionella sp.]